MLKRVFQILNEDVIENFNVYQCDCCKNEINEGDPLYFEAPNTHICGDCAFINGYITEKEYLNNFCFWLSLNNLRAEAKDGQIFITNTKFPWEKKSNADRFTPEYKLWRKSVFERDNYTCAICGKTGGELNAHHIKPYAKYKSLRFEIDNGITLCKECHKIQHRKRK